MEQKQGTKSVLIALFFAVEKVDNREPGFIYVYDVKVEDVKFDTGHTVAIKSALNFMSQKELNSFLELSGKILNAFPNKELEKFPEKDLYTELLKLSVEQQNLKENGYTELIGDFNESCKLFMELLNQRAKVRERLIYPIKIYQDLSKSHLVLPAKSTERIRQQQGAFIFPRYVS